MKYTHPHHLKHLLVNREDICNKLYKLCRRRRSSRKKNKKEEYYLEQLKQLTAYKDIAKLEINLTKHSSKARQITYSNKAYGLLFE